MGQAEERGGCQRGTEVKEEAYIVGERGEDDCGEGGNVLSVPASQPTEIIDTKK